MLLYGPDLLQNLIGVLLHFQLGKIAFTSDIHVAFHQSNVPLDDQTFMRLLWWLQGDTSKESGEHCMTVHISREKSSPSVANFALVQTIQEKLTTPSYDVLER